MGNFFFTKMKYFILFAILAFSLARAAPTSDVWELFKAVHDKTYETEAEDLLRKEIFLNNVQNIEEHNQRFEAGEESFKQGINHFADWTGSVEGAHAINTGELVSLSEE